MVLALQKIHSMKKKLNPVVMIPIVMHVSSYHKLKEIIANFY